MTNYEDKIRRFILVLEDEIQMMEDLAANRLHEKRHHECVEAILQIQACHATIGVLERLLEDD